MDGLGNIGCGAHHLPVEDHWQEHSLHFGPLQSSQLVPLLSNYCLTSGTRLQNMVLPIWVRRVCQLGFFLKILTSRGSSKPPSLPPHKEHSNQNKRCVEKGLQGFCRFCIWTAGRIAAQSTITDKGGILEERWVQFCPCYISVGQTFGRCLRTL